MDEKQRIALIASELGIQTHQVKNTVELLDAQNTVPFIARYRKEMTGSLDEEQIRTIQDRMHYLRNLEDRKNTVLKSIEGQGKLTPELAQKIEAAMTLREVEDLYLPFKPKKRTRATIAREKGLEPLAHLILEQEITEGDPLAIASEYVDDEKGVATAEDALAGARDIVAERISDDADIRTAIRALTFESGQAASAAVAPEAARDYEIYQEFSEPVKTIPPHRILALNRGEKEGMLRVWIDVEEEEVIRKIESICIRNQKSIFTKELRKAISDGYRRLLAPAVKRDVRRTLTEKADQHAIDVFAVNLKALLMTPPLRGKIILGIDPGYRTGCKVAVIDKTGKYVTGDTIYPHPPQSKWEEAKNTVQRLMDEHGVDVIAIGNGTASRETEKLAAEIIHESNRDIQYTIINEAGASVYSASSIAQKEFPDLEASMRGNISIARRLADPLSELVKIDPKSIGVGLYQHDVDQTKLTESLDRVVESCVNAVGVNLNTASSSLLRYVSGINSRVAEHIIAYRENHGEFKRRDELRKVGGLGDHTFLQSAGFLRIPDSDRFFDSTAVHPESYESAQRLLDHLNLDVHDVRSDGTVVRKTIRQKKLSLDSLAQQCGCGLQTLTDIIDSLEKPHLDPREAMDSPILRSDVMSLDDLYEGMVLKGTVRNVVDFGAFVDIGVKQDGLIHLSQMAKKYIKHPLDVVSVGDVVEVKVLSVDKERGRIGLSMILD